MTTAHRFVDADHDHFEDVVAEGFAGARQGAVVLVEARGVPSQRRGWLARQVEQLLPGGLVHVAPEGLLLVLLRHTGPGEAWHLVERLKRQLAKTGWERTVVGSAVWPVQGHTPMDVVAAALVSLSDERERCEEEWALKETLFAVDDERFTWASASELLTG